MVHGVEDFAVHDFFELLEIDNESGARIDFAFDRDFERVVVAVSVGIVALAKKTLVLFRSEIRIVIVVRGGKFGFAGQINHKYFLLLQHLELLAMNRRESTRIGTNEPFIGCISFRRRSRHYGSGLNSAGGSREYGEIACHLLRTGLFLLGTELFVGLEHNNFIDIALAMRRIVGEGEGDSLLLVDPENEGTVAQTRPPAAREGHRLVDLCNRWPLSQGRRRW